MPTFLLRVEAVNLAHVVYDTHDLSTIRGGGLAVLNGPRRDVLEKLKAATAPDGTAWSVQNPSLITSGPSLAVFGFESTDVVTAGDVRDHVVKWLTSDATLKHATFVVKMMLRSDEQTAGNFRRDSESLLARTRWGQMQQCRLAIPTIEVAIAEEPRTAQRSCGIDFVRPATHQHPVLNDAKKMVSESVSTRSLYGFKRKQGFYLEEVGWHAPDESSMAWNFHQIAARGPHRVGYDRAKPDPLSRLHDKLAVIYIDGNKFGKQQLAYVNDEARQKKWDEHVQSFRKQVLKTLLDQTALDDGWKCQLGDQEVTRLETLLWGGDELMWVVPAWKGWSTVQLFLEEAEKFYRSFEAAPPQIPRPATPARGGSRSVPNMNLPRRQTAPTAVAAVPTQLQRLTHAVGLVFCHADAPIQRVRKLAEDLCGLGKDRNERTHGTKEGSYKSYSDIVSYAVLESFDQLGGDVLEARRRHFPERSRENAEIRNALTRTREEFRELTDVLSMVKQSGFPRGSVYRVVRAWQAGHEQDFNRWLTRGEREGGKIPESLRKFEQGHLWLHVAELWDYVHPEVVHA